MGTEKIDMATDAARRRAALKRMDEFMLMEDRAKPLFFGGRADELDWLRKRLEGVAKGLLQGATTIVQGVPGMGKTALGREFANQVQGSKCADRPVLCARLTENSLAYPPLALVRNIWRLACQFQRDVQGQSLAGQARIALDKAGDAALLLQYDKSACDLVERKHGLNADSPLDACLNVYRDSLWPSPDAVLVLVLDEMQNCPVNDHSMQAMSELHQGFSCGAVLPICLGLPGVQDKVRALGVSRLSIGGMRELGCLSEKEAADVIEGTIDSLGMDGLAKASGHQAAWPAWCRAMKEGMAQSSCGFPQHITTGLLAACRVMRANPEKFISKDALSSIADLHESLKRDCYAARVSDFGGFRNAPAFGALCSRLEQCPGAMMSESKAISFLSECTGLDSRASEDMLRAAQRRGLAGSRFSESGLQMVAPPPIPSMGGHLKSMFAEALPENHELQEVNNAYGLLPAHE